MRRRWIEAVIIVSWFTAFLVLLLAVAALVAPPMVWIFGSIFGPWFKYWGL